MSIEPGIRLVVVGIAVTVRLRVPVGGNVPVRLAVRGTIRDGLRGVVEAESLVESLVGLSAKQYVEQGGKGTEETLACSQNKRGVELLRGSSVYMLEGNGY